MLNNPQTLHIQKRQPFRLAQHSHGAGDGNRTRVCSLGSCRNNHYTTPAGLAIIVQNPNGAPPSLPFSLLFRCSDTTNGGTAIRARALHDRLAILRSLLTRILHFLLSLAFYAIRFDSHTLPFLGCSASPRCRLCDRLLTHNLHRTSNPLLRDTAFRCYIALTNSIKNAARSSSSSASMFSTVSAASPKKAAFPLGAIPAK